MEQKHMGANPMSMGTQNTTDNLCKERDRWVKILVHLMDAAEPFLAEPPAEMNGDAPFSQFTDAEDCRKLYVAYNTAEAELKRSSAAQVVLAKMGQP